MVTEPSASAEEGGEEGDEGDDVDVEVGVKPRPGWVVPPRAAVAEEYQERDPAGKRGMEYPEGGSKLTQHVGPVISATRCCHVNKRLVRGEARGVSEREKEWDEAEESAGDGEAKGDDREAKTVVAKADGPPG